MHTNSPNSISSTKQIIAVSATIFLLLLGYLSIKSKEVALPELYKRTASSLLNQLNFSNSTSPTQIENSPTTQATYSLPFCLLIMGRNLEQKQAINASIIGLQYRNFKAIDGGFSPLEQGYEGYHKLVQQNCGEQDIVMFVSRRLQMSSLEYLNVRYQQDQPYLLYWQTNTILEPITFSAKVYHAVSTQESYNTNQVYLNSGQWIPQRQAHVLAIFQLSAAKMGKLEKQKVFEQANSQLSYFWMSLNSANLYSWKQYKPLPHNP